MSRTLFTGPVEQNADIGNGELFGTGWLQLGNTFYVHIANVPTSITHRVVVLVCIWVKPRCPNAHVDQLQLTQLGEFSQRLIDGSQ